MKTLMVVLCLLSQSVWAAEPLGRLFSTPAERESLDRLRQSAQGALVEEIPKAEPGQEALQPATPPVNQQLSVQGYVKRSDGARGTVWVNQQPMQENSAHGHVQVGKLPRESNRVPLKMPDTGSQVQLKAGQVFDAGSGQVRESNVHVREPGAQPAPAEYGVIR